MPGIPGPSDWDLGGTEIVSMPVPRYAYTPGSGPTTLSEPIGSWCRKFSMASFEDTGWAPLRVQR